MIRAFSGRSADHLTLDRLARDEIDIVDVRIHPETLEHQAQVAEEHGNPQLAANFRRAAELALVGEGELMALYEAMRPHRSTAAQLAELATSFEGRPAPLIAALVREAAEVYARRGLLVR